MIKIERIDNYLYCFKGSDKNGIRHVAKALTFDNPDPYAYSHKIEKFDKRHFTFRIGMLNTLLEYLDSNELKYQIEDFDYKFPDSVEIDDRMNGKFIHQRKAVEKFFTKRFGIICVPTRGGKTFIASEILRIFLDTDEGDFLFVTDNTTLFNQAIGDIKKYFERYGGIEVGEIRSGEIDIKRVTVAMIQTIQSTLSKRCSDNAKKKYLEKYIKGLKFLCVDEIHDNCSDSKLKIYKKAKKLGYQLCLSATPYRSGAFVQNLKLKEWSGDIVYEITEKELRERGVLSDYIVIMLLVDHNSIAYDFKECDYNEYRNLCIFESVERNGVLEDLIRILFSMHVKTLVLFQSVEHGKMISKITGIPFISGETESDVREREKNRFLNDDGGFLLASNIFKKGVTLPQVEVLINVDGGLEDANTIQKKGRVLGATEKKKKSVVIDFFDMFDEYFSEHSKTRLNTYVESVGENGVKIFDTSIYDWGEGVRKEVERWLGKESFTNML